MMGSTEKADPAEAVRLEIIDSSGQPAEGCDEPRSEIWQIWEVLDAVLREPRPAEKKRKGETYAD